MSDAQVTFVDVVAGMLEVLASQRPDLLAAYLDMASHSPLRFALLELARVCDTGLDDLGRVVHTASRDLDRLGRRKRWRHPKDVVRQPNLGGLLVLCRARRERIGGTGQRRRLGVMERKLSEAYEIEKTHRWIVEFLDQ